MALTKTEKDLLDKKLIKVLKSEEFFGKDLTIKKISIPRDVVLGKINNDYALVSVKSSLSRIEDNLMSENRLLHSCYNSNSKEFELELNEIKKLILKKASCSKDKNILSLSIAKDLQYDFITHKFNIEDLKDYEGYDYFFTKDFFTLLQNCEWIFNYFTDLFEIRDLLGRVSLDDIKVMPKGLYGYMQEKNIKELKTQILLEYMSYSRFGKDYKFISNVFGEYLPERYIFCEKVCPVKKVLSFLKKDLNEGYLGVMSNSKVREFYSDLTSIIKSNLEDKIVFDDNRGIQHNHQVLKDILDRERENMLAKQLQRLNFINGLTFDDEYIVVVPQNQEEKRAEGKMQHNCVGHYYDHSILTGNNLIYFLRKKENLNHSYITCRYNVPHKDTIEYRKVNNTSVKDKKEEEIIKRISEIIRNGLE